MFEKWPMDLKLLTFMSAQSATTKDELKSQIKLARNELRGLCRRHCSEAMRPIKVSLLDLDWYFRDRRNFVAFSKLLQYLPKSVYSSELVVCVLDRFWDINK